MPSPYIPTFHRASTCKWECAGKDHKALEKSFQHGRNIEMNKLKKSIENGDKKMSKITIFNMGWCCIYEVRAGCYNKGAIKE